MAVSPTQGSPDYVFTLPPDEAEWLVVDTTTEPAGEKGDSYPPAALKSAATGASWAAFCAQSPRPLVIEDDSSDPALSPTVHLPSATQAPILSPIVPESKVAAVVSPELARQVQPRVVNYYPLWSGRGAHSAGYRGRPRSSHSTHIITPPPRRAAESSAPRGKHNRGGRSGTKGV